MVNSTKSTGERGDHQQREDPAAYEGHSWPEPAANETTESKGEDPAGPRDHAEGSAAFDPGSCGGPGAGLVRDKDLLLVDDRTEAIRFALKPAHKGDTVLRLGKGHEKTIERADGEHEWDEIGTAHKVLQK